VVCCLKKDQEKTNNGTKSIIEAVNSTSLLWERKSMDNRNDSCSRRMNRSSADKGGEEVLLFVNFYKKEVSYNLGEKGKPEEEVQKGGRTTRAWDLYRRAKVGTNKILVRGRGI